MPSWWRQVQDALHPPPKRRFPSAKDEKPRSYPRSSTDASVYAPLLSPTFSSASSAPSSASSSPRLLPSRRRQQQQRRPNLFLPFVLLTCMCLVVLGGLALSLRAMAAAPAALLAVHDREIAHSGGLWHRFGMIEKYYGGLYALVPAHANVPAYPPRAAARGRARLLELTRKLREEGGEGADGGYEKPEEEGSGVLAKSRVYAPRLSVHGHKGGDGENGEVEEEVVECDFGTTASGAPRERPEVRVFDGLPSGMPEPIFGSHALLGLNGGVCFDRFGRLGPYGFGYREDAGGLGVGLFRSGPSEANVETARGLGAFPIQRVDWRGVDWANLQSECASKNAHRFKTPAGETTEETTEEATDDAASIKTNGTADTVTMGEKQGKQKGKLARTAILLRAYSDYTYTPNDIASMRSLIAESALYSGGAYDVHILLHLKSPSSTAFTPTSHMPLSEALSAIPSEFHGLVTTWTEYEMTQRYPALVDTVHIHNDDDEGGNNAEWFRGLPVHGVYRAAFMPIQAFAEKHTQYEHFWNWEMDVRYTGHWGELFDRLDSWTAAQPTGEGKGGDGNGDGKGNAGLWARNERFFVPEVHGSWEQFVASTSHSSSSPSSSSSSSSSFPSTSSSSSSPSSNSSASNPIKRDTSSYINGVGQSADLITLNPLFDPSHTTWLLRDDHPGYPTGIPRRASIITATRLSRRLLAAMHAENAAGRAMFSEMFPGSVAFAQGGLKAVFAPHPVYVDRKWPVPFLTKTFLDHDDGKQQQRQQSASAAASGGVVAGNMSGDDNNSNAAEGTGGAGGAGGAGVGGGKGWMMFPPTWSSARALVKAAPGRVWGERENSFYGSSWYYNAGFPGKLYRRWLGIETWDGGEGLSVAERERVRGRMCLPAMLVHPVKAVVE